MMRRLALVCLLVWALAAPAADNPYDLSPERVAPDTYVFRGEVGEFARDNHGNVVNTGFIVTSAGVVVIDTGPSRLYGEAMRTAIATVTDRSVARVYITHHHPDHYLGNQAFDDVPVAALPETIERIRTIGDELARYLYERVGGAMRGTVSVPPDTTVESGTSVTFGDHELALIGSRGHSQADLAVLDRDTGVLFAGDIAFHDRAPATPDAELPAWQRQIEALASREFRVLVPGHGPVAWGGAPLDQTGAYLDWLEGTLRGAAAEGLSMPEIMFRPLPERWRGLAVMPAEFHRSVSHLYPALERRALPARGD